MGDYEYEKCPNCGERKPGRAIYMCTACKAFYGCWDQYGNGCWGTGEACHNKNCQAVGKYVHSGRITAT